MKFLENVSLTEYTTFRIGGKARYFCVVKNENELREALNFAKSKKVPLFVLGGGSNILFSDDGFSGLVIKMEILDMNFEKRDNEVIVIVGAGENWDEFVSKTVEKNLWGIENLSGIPGTVGAAPVQNIGAYGMEIENVVESVSAIDIRTGKVRIFSNKECGFTYRESFFKTPLGKNFVITSIVLKLKETGKPNLSYKDLKEYFISNQNPTIREVRNAVIEIRKGKFPDLNEVGTAGSFWKNPIISKQQFEKLKTRYPNMPFFPFGDQIKIPLAWILDNVCGLKGYTKSKTGLWRNQPLVVVAERGASAIDIKSLALHIARIVKEKTDMDIEKEVQYI